MTQNTQSQSYGYIGKTNLNNIEIFKYLGVKLVQNEPGVDDTESPTESNLKMSNLGRIKMFCSTDKYG